jgi:integrase
MAIPRAVDPIKSLEDIRSIKQMLLSKPRDYLLFVMGINSGIRLGDLLKFRVRQFQGRKVGASIEITESKTGKQNFLVINREVDRALKLYFDSTEVEPDSYLFRSRKAGQPLTLCAVNRMVKVWASSINLKGNYGGRTLRKTFGYIQRVHFGVGFEVLCKRYNHSNPSVTMRYIGVQPEEITNIMMHEI